MWVKMKPQLLHYAYITEGKYYKVVKEEYDYDHSCWTYMIIDDCSTNRIFCKDLFEEPVTHVRCIDNTGCGDVLTCMQEYEIISFQYVGTGLVMIENDNGHKATYSLKRFNLINKIKEKLVKHDGYTHVICKDNDGQWGSLTNGKKYEVIETNNNMVKIVDDVDDYGWYSVVRFEFVTEDTPEILFKSQEPRICNLGEIAESLESLPTTKYHITYSIEYAAGAELADITKPNIIGIDGEIVSKGRTWVIETERGTVIIPFKAIIHMHPQY